MLNPYRAYADVDNVVAVGPAVGCSVGGVTSGDPGAAASSSHPHWHGQETLSPPARSSAGGIVAAGSTIDLSVGGVPSGIPGPALPSSYLLWRGRERLTREGGPTQVCEVALFVAADAF